METSIELLLVLFERMDMAMDEGESIESFLQRWTMLLDKEEQYVRQQIRVFSKDLKRTKADNFFETEQMVSSIRKNIYKRMFHMEKRRKYAARLTAKRIRKEAIELSSLQEKMDISYSDICSLKEEVNSLKALLKDVHSLMDVMIERIDSSTQRYIYFEYTSKISKSKVTLDLLSMHVDDIYRQVNHELNRKEEAIINAYMILESTEYLKLPSVQYV
ncbi:hypothetical protein CN918_30335 [Priestia megaterium]|nr:hypothetical protein CN918_30335 [Priestia megaterium]